MGTATRCPFSFVAGPVRCPRTHGTMIESSNSRSVKTSPGALGISAAEATSMYKLLVESVRDYAIFILDPTGHVMTWNAGAKRLKGYSASDIIGKHFSTFY